jgi:hypothetical protein
MSKFISFICTFFVMFVGYGCFQFYITNEISIISCIMGFVGFVVILSPAWDMWQKIFDEIFSQKED